MTTSSNWFTNEIEQTKIRFAALRKMDAFIDETACIAETMIEEAAIAYEIKILEQIQTMCDDAAYEEVSLDELEFVSDRSSCFLPDSSDVYSVGRPSYEELIAA